jgi:hypothetical protein
MFRKLLIGLSLLASVALFQAAPLVSAQQVTQDIQNGLCAGSDLNFSDNPPPNSCNKSSNGVNKVNHILRHIVNLLSAIVGVVAVIMIIVGGFRYITSGGNDTSVTGAKNTILYAIIGLIIVALAQVIVRFVLDKIVNA